MLLSLSAHANTTGGGALGELARMPLEEAIGLANPALVIGFVIAGVGLFFGLKLDPFVQLAVGGGLLGIATVVAATFGLGATP